MKLNIIIDLELLLFLHSIEFMMLFYPNKTRKVIPNFMETYLTPLALAV